MRKLLIVPGLAVSICAFFTTGVLAETLQEAVIETINTNPNIQATKSQRNAVEQEMEQARSGFFPQVDINVGHGWETSDNSSTRADGEDNRNLDRSEAEIIIRQLLFDGFETESEFDRQKARVNSRAYRTFGTSEEVALEAIEAYLDVLRKQSLVKIAQENLAVHDKTFTRIQKRGKRGVGRRSDTEQALGRLALAQSSLMSAENNLRDAEVTYEAIIGDKPDSLETPNSLAYLLPASLDEAITFSLDNHPTLKSAEADVDAAKSQQRTAKAAFFPRVHLEISGSENNDLDGIPGPNRDGQIMVRGRYNLKGGKDIARKKETAHLLNEAKEIRNQTRRQVIESIQLSWNARQTSMAQLEFFQTHVTASGKARNAYEKQFNLGQRSLLDLLDSTNEHLSAQTDYINGEFNVLFSVYRILAGSGKLLWALQVPVPDEASVIQ